MSFRDVVFGSTSNLLNDVDVFLRSLRIPEQIGCNCGCCRGPSCMLELYAP